MGNGNLNNNKICIINVYFGQFPRWIDFFLVCCKKNSGIDFLFYSDNEIIKINSENIKQTLFSIDDFNQLATKKLGFKINIYEPYKVCDFKPAFGKIFEDYLTDYEYWGYCDLDIVFGNIINHIINKIRNKPDLISGYADYISGPFCLIRNCKLMNELYTQGSNFKKIFQTELYQGFDEGLITLPKCPWTLKKVMIFLYFIVISQISVLKSGFYTLEELKFKFHFYYKKLNISIPQDFSEIVWLTIKNKKIKAFLSNFIYSDASFERMKTKNWTVYYSDGRLIEIKTKRGLLVFHFRLSKNRRDFQIKDQVEPTNNFEVTHEGIKYLK